MLHVLRMVRRFQAKIPIPAYLVYLVKPRVLLFRFKSWDKLTPCIIYIFLFVIVLFLLLFLNIFT
ncbi:hypothetical protein BDF20DRAFT_891979 [Mycotypha africana]|uniref:uncharacterized protein n=1 Tax=Mycotypha africana TaxID=64632 RepID=UPI002301C795|nr:uncharacterized protein BDF20DRAFT_891979 [Mycotypha africana]KAI8968881.1 hypothetical protein BDF20DRAFT_891979 [Mycotypha africana]